MLAGRSSFPVRMASHVGGSSGAGDRDPAVAGRVAVRVRWASRAGLADSPRRPELHGSRLRKVECEGLSGPTQPARCLDRAGHPCPVGGRCVDDDAAEVVRRRQARRAAQQRSAHPQTPPPPPQSPRSRRSAPIRKAGAASASRIMPPVCPGQFQPRCTRVGNLSTGSRATRSRSSVG